MRWYWGRDADHLDGGTARQSGGHEEHGWAMVTVDRLPAALEEMFVPYGVGGQGIAEGVQQRRYVVSIQGVQKLANVCV